MNMEYSDAENPWYCRRANGSFFERKKFAFKSRGVAGIVIKKSVPDRVDGFLLFGDHVPVDSGSPSPMNVDVSDGGDKEPTSGEKSVGTRNPSSGRASTETAAGVVQILVEGDGGSGSTPSSDSDKKSEISSKEVFFFQIKGEKEVIIPRCGNLDEYEFLHQIGRGGFGTVFKAREKNTGEIVAIKEVDSKSKSTWREIEILQALSLRNSPCFVEFKKVVMDDNDNVYIVLEYIEKDLNKTLEAMVQPFSEAEVKPLMYQLLYAVDFLHKNSIMHRDLKPSNLLFNGETGRLKICDFGLARRFERRVDCFSPRVMTPSYKAPEIILGSEKYSCAVDIWSAGCIMAELLLKDVVFKRTTGRKQAKEIYAILGEPNDVIWPGFSSLPGSKVRLIKQPHNLLRENFPTLSDLGLDLLGRLLTYDPEKRITAEDALMHDWFSEFNGSDRRKDQE